MTPLLVLWRTSATLALVVLAAACGGSETVPQVSTDGGADAGFDDGGPHGQPPADPIHGWILLNSNAEVVERSIEAAAGYGVNHIQLSHGLMMNIDEVLTGDEEATQRVAALEEAAQLADQHGIETFVWAHEMSAAPLDICFGPEGEIWKQRADAYRDAFSLLPHVDGAVIMFGSAPVPVWGMLCTCDWCEATYPEATPFQSPPVDERIRIVTEQVGGAIVNELGKGLIMRTFVHAAQENAWHAEGLAAARGVEFFGMHKSETQDWQPYNPPDPTMGMAERRYSVLEMDVAGEYYGLSELPFCSPGYFRYRLNHAWENLGVGVAVRIERGDKSALGTPNEVNIRAISELVRNRTTPLVSIWDGYIADTYGFSAGSTESEQLRSILADTFSIRLKSHYVLGIWAFDKGSDIPASNKLDQFNDRGEMPEWDPDWQPLWDALNEPDLATVQQVYQEGQEAVLLAASSLQRFDVIASQLEPDAFEDLHRRMRHQHFAARAWRSAKLLIFANRAQTRGGVQDPVLDGWKAWAHQDLSKIADEMEQDGLTGVSLASPARILALVAATEQLVDTGAPPSEPVAFFSPIRTDQVTGTSATLQFETHEAAAVTVDYGLQIPDFGMNTQVDVEAGSEASVVLSGLAPGKRYVVRLRATVAGREVVSGYHWVFTE